MHINFFSIFALFLFFYIMDIKFLLKKIFLNLIFKIIVLKVLMGK